MRPSEKRFLGRHKKWQITCSRCSATSRPIRANKRSSIPPEIIIKKLSQAGWTVGNNAKTDICPECAKKPIKSAAINLALDVAAKALKDAQAPMVPVNGHRVHFTELKQAASALDPQSAKELMDILRQQVPKPVPKAKPKPEPAPKLTPSEYEAWLDGLDK